MANGVYTGIGDIAKKVKKIYVGVGDVAKEVKKIYVGENGVAKLAYSPGKKWVNNTWYGDISSISAYTGSINPIVTNKTDTYYFDYRFNNKFYKLNKTNSKLEWKEQPWTSGSYIPSDTKGLWTDGEDFYSCLSSAGTSVPIRLNKNTNEWEYCSITNSDKVNYFRYIWLDDIGNNVLYSNGVGSNNQMILVKSSSPSGTTLSWGRVSWSGLNPVGDEIWSDGADIYCSSGTTQKVLNYSNGSWNDITWTGLTNFYGYDVWSDGTNIYCSNGSKTYIKDGTTWTEIVINGSPSGMAGRYVWTDGENVYYDNGVNHKILV